MTTRHDYKALDTGKKSKKLTMITNPSERQSLPAILTLSTIKATDYQRDQNSQDQRQVPKSYWDARKGAKWKDWDRFSSCEGSPRVGPPDFVFPGRNWLRFSRAELASFFQDGIAFVFPGGKGGDMLRSKA